MGATHRLVWLGCRNPTCRSRSIAIFCNGWPSAHLLTVGTHLYFAGVRATGLWHQSARRQTAAAALSASEHGLDLPLAGYPCPPIWLLLPSGRSMYDDETNRRCFFPNSTTTGILALYFPSKAILRMSSRHPRRKKKPLPLVQQQTRNWRGALLHRERHSARQHANMQHANTWLHHATPCCSRKGWWRCRAPAALECLGGEGCGYRSPIWVVVAGSKVNRRCLKRSQCQEPQAKGCCQSQAARGAE